MLQVSIGSSLAHPTVFWRGDPVSKQSRKQSDSSLFILLMDRRRFAVWWILLTLITGFCGIQNALSTETVVNFSMIPFAS